MSSMISNPIDWTEQEYKDFGLKPQVNAHSYHKLPWFGDEALIELLDSYPRENLQAHTMGLDPLNFHDWTQVNITAQTTGKQMLEAVQNGRIWLNLTQIEKHSAQYGDLVAGMYKHIGENCLRLSDSTSTHSALLISSPAALVYYHLDAEPNMIWHMRGQKNIWIYPAMDLNFAPQESIEEIYACEVEEDLPYRPEFDDSATYYLLKPGDAASWPHNAPHRIVNVDMNVSLATSYYTSDTYNRKYVQLANRFLLRNMGIKNRSMREVGLIPSLKRITYRLINKIRPFASRDRTAFYTTDLELDPTMPLGYRKIDNPVLPAFAKAANKPNLVDAVSRAA